uniref:Adenylate kinase active site lid domain-containing protein n=1 Tax=Neobodo designis TaxID=312471 RepID=A0A7S1MAY1_NEODS|mmetsp:Transcript_3699/g.11703  ORF Transcript_3699/g.11703 Transcript_3699/m.11703 type:complete len:200 (+) Transcript_3699:31-630(+)|eukprot:CAMPEP_0174853262 /NCGR_PEP_ID=MMETSP1114-20130205/27721_1 /TAXON_ID=312471 /ORGANISM="Neobodo designis, Strain CCAP 1951/1" /LENGTH=199 /DNA_ID=CAMNT_0016087893 /DNA_START=30 /DNA_END=629 /DNA_ORIENTATION=+
MTTVSAPCFFILGGPGSGKGTNCERLVEDFGFKHFSAGDLLRAEGKKETPLGEKIRSIIAAGNIVPSEITVELLRNAIAEAGSGQTGFLIDGFPRKLDQAQMFEDGIAKARGIVYFDCSMEEMEKRLLSRAAAGSGRSDDNAEAIRHRFKVNVEQCMPVVEKYDAEQRCFRIDANRDRDVVYTDVKKLFAETFGCKPKQ